jgi:hypothetical protein
MGMVGMSQNLQPGNAPSHPPHLAYMQGHPIGGDGAAERLKVSSNLKQQYQSEHLHSSYYH